MLYTNLELSYLAFSQNSLSNSPCFASIYFVVYISNHIKMTDKIPQGSYILTVVLQ